MKIRITNKTTRYWHQWAHLGTDIAISKVTIVTDVLRFSARGEHSE